jgi:hypothetical protein
MEIRVIEAIWRWWRKWCGREDRVEEMVKEKEDRVEEMLEEVVWKGKTCEEIVEEVLI